MIRTRFNTLFASIALCATPSIALAGSGFDIAWYSIDAGGGTSSGGGFELTGTIGQPDAGAMAGEFFSLSGGYWAGSAVVIQPPCPEDLDDSGDVGFNDLLILLSSWDESGVAADLDGSGTVAFGDLLILLSAWGAC